MVQYSPALDRAFFALADGTRRGILQRLRHGSATISELAAPAGISLTGMKKHVQVLVEAELVSTIKVGRERHCRLDPRGIDRLSEWLEGYRLGWEDRFDRLEALIEKRKEESP